MTSVQVHPRNGTYLTSSADGSFRVLQKTQLMLQASPHQSHVSCARFSRSAQFASLLASAAGDGSVRLFNILNQQEIASFEGPSGGANWLDWHCDGAVLAVCGADRACRLLDVDLGRVLQRFERSGAAGELQAFQALR